MPLPAQKFKNKWKLLRMEGFFVSGPIPRYQSAFSQGCNAIQSHSKLQKYFYGLVSFECFCLLGLLWVCLFGVLLCFVFSQSSHLNCVPIKPLSGKIFKWVLFKYVLCALACLNVFSWVPWYAEEDDCMEVTMILPAIQSHKSPVSSLLRTLGMQGSRPCQSLSHNNRGSLGHSDHEVIVLDPQRRRGG